MRKTQKRNTKLLLKGKIGECSANTQMQEFLYPLVKKITEAPLVLLICHFILLVAAFIEQLSNK